MGRGQLAGGSREGLVKIEDKETVRHDADNALG